MKHKYGKVGESRDVTWLLWDVQIFDSYPDLCAAVQLFLLRSSPDVPKFSDHLHNHWISRRVLRFTGVDTYPANQVQISPALEPLSQSAPSSDRLLTSPALTPSQDPPKRARNTL